MSVEGVANELYISKSIIKLIESDEYDLNAPDAVFMRGYIRSYARLVGLSEDEVGAAFRSLGVVTDVKNVSEHKKIKIREVSLKDKPIRLITNFVIIVLVILVLIWWYSHYIANNKVQPPVISAEQPVSNLQTDISVNADTQVQANQTNISADANTQVQADQTNISAIQPQATQTKSVIQPVAKLAENNSVTKKTANTWVNPDAQ
jgi:cytoskeleton protein RodZ